MIRLEFFRKFSSTPLQTHRGVGIECEIPVVSVTGEAVSLALMQSMYDYLGTQGFDLHHDEFTGLVTAATRPNPHSAESFIYDRDTITVDAGFSTLEIALAPQRDLFTVQDTLNQMLALLVPWFEKRGCRLLGYGIQPLTLPSRKLLTPGDRYLFTEQFSANRLIPKTEGVDADLLNITASNQCHLEVSQEEAVTAVNLLNAFSGLTIALHANSPIWKGSLNGDYIANREMFWDDCFPDRPGRTGIPKQFSSNEDYIDHLLEFPPFLIEREGQYLQIRDHETFASYLAATEPAEGKTIFGGNRAVLPKIEDIHQHVSFFWYNARLVPKHGTVESRMCCQQPPKETLTSSALSLGILSNQQEAIELMESQPWAAWQNLRKEAASRTFSARMNGRSILPLLGQLLSIAKRGLESRGMGEEVLLTPLFDRLERRKSPGDDAMEVFQEKGLPGLIEHFSFSSSEIISGQVEKSAPKRSISSHQ